MTQKYLTVYGELARPGVYLAPAGTYVTDLLEMAGLTAENSHELMCIGGGPMMGDRIDVGEAAVKKTTNGLLVTDRGMFQRRKEAHPAARGSSRDKRLRRTS